MQAELKALQIDRSKKSGPEPARWATRWIIGGVLLFVLLGAARFAYTRLTAATEVETIRVHAESSAAAGPGVVLNATGYIVAAHRIEVASKVVGRVAWIGVEKGDKVKAGQVLVRLEDDEYAAQLTQAKGQLANLQAKLAELEHGSRPEEIAVARANLNQAKSDQENALITLNRTKKLASEGVMAKQALDDAQAKFDSAAARVNSLQKTLDLSVLGPRQEQIDSMRGQVEQAKGAVAYAETQQSNTVIRAPVSGTVLERAVEKGEFLTTMFVGDKGAKGYVVALADLNDLEVELDISQNDFAKLHARQKGIVTTDAFPDRKYDGIIYEISPEANRQKATVQIKVKVLNPDDYLRPEMNASVAFVSDEKTASVGAQARPVIMIPAAAIHDNAVFVIFDGKAVRRAVKTGSTNSKGIRIEDGLIGGEDLILNPPATLKDGDRVKAKQS
ncbi:MAG TPA: efflux RND transporter periplasmic adaptor subunit [Bryobacteraceae bacterium]|nr:efflux RND transporter periplasmic adaptor subunit [Bryobacteraceae bacterium]HXJ43706.1 efflux RND transporter periplasmic adaptor subunit [Bryobacteraceae bacterium]